jgi:hypothetical protein
VGPLPKTLDLDSLPKNPSESQTLSHAFQTIAFSMADTGECGEQKLNHRDGQAEEFYRDLMQRGIRERVGMEATGYSRCRASPIWRGDPNPASRRPASSLHAQSCLIDKDFPSAWVRMQRALRSFAMRSLVFCGRTPSDPRFDSERNGHGVPFTSLVGDQLSFW